MKNYHYVDYMLRERRKDELAALEKERFIKLSQPDQDKPKPRELFWRIIIIFRKLKLRKINELV